MVLAKQNEAILFEENKISRLQDKVQSLKKVKNTLGRQALLSIDLFLHGDAKKRALDLFNRLESVKITRYGRGAAKTDI